MKKLGEDESEEDRRTDEVGTLAYYQKLGDKDAKPILYKERKYFDT